MADNKSGRDKQAQDVDRRQRERDLAAELSRKDEPEPPVDTAALVALEEELDSLTFPASGADIVAAVGDRVIEATGKTYPLETLVAETDLETFESPTAVTTRIQRPTVATAMKRVVEAVATLPNAKLRQSQRDAYERTFRALEAVDADDEDEGIRTMADWIVDRIHDKEAQPGSRDVRRQAAKFTRANGYEVRDDEWLGI